MKLALCLVLALAVVGGARAGWPAPRNGNWPQSLEPTHGWANSYGAYGGLPAYGAAYGPGKCMQVDPNQAEPTYLALVTAEYLDLVGVWNCTGTEDVVTLSSCYWNTQPNVTNWNITFALYCNVNAPGGQVASSTLAALPSLTVDATIQDPAMAVELLPSDQPLVANKSECDNLSIPSTPEIQADRVNMIWKQELKALGWSSPYVKCQNVTKTVVDECVLWRYPAYEWRLQFNATCASDSTMAPLTVKGSVFTYPPNVTINYPTGVGRLDLTGSQNAW